MKFSKLLLTLCIGFMAATSAMAQLPSGTVAGILMQGLNRWPYKDAVVIRIQRDNGVIDTTRTSGLFRDTVVSDSMGMFRILVPLRANGQITQYMIQGRDCNGLLANPMTFNVSPTVAGRPTYNLCRNTPPPCNLNANFFAEPGATGNPLMMAFRLVSLPVPTVPYYSVWTFGDGSSDSTSILTAGVTHTYSSPGTYRVCHTLSIPGTTCSRQVCMSIRVGVPIYVSGRILANNVCVTDSTIIEFFGLNAGQYQAIINRDSLGNCSYWGAVPPGQYLIRATPLAPSLTGQGYVPTYFPSSIFWDSLNVVNINTMTTNLDIRLRLLDSTYPQGPRRVRVSFAGEGTLVQSPLQAGGMRPFAMRDARVYLRSRSGRVLAWAHAPTGNMVEFGNLPEGEYRISSDLPYLMAQTQDADLRTSTTANVAYTATSGGVVATVTSIRGMQGQALRVYPNPATTAVQLSLPGAKGAAMVRVMAADGRTVRMVETSFIENGLTLKLDGLDTGLYMVTLSQADGGTAAVRLQLTR